MIQTIAQLQAEPLMLMSVVKPILLLAALGVWAWLVGRLDKDAAYYYLDQKNWGMAHIGAGVLGFAVMLLVPIFWIAWPIGVLILAGEVYGYIAYRNTKVPADEKWSGMDILNKVQKEREIKATEKARSEAVLKLFSKDEEPLNVPFGEDPRAAAFELFQKLLVFSVERGADRLEIVVEAEKASFVARIDGIRYPQQAPEPKLGLQLIDYLKENAGMDLAERRRKQTGRMWVEVEGYDRNTLELTTAGSTKALQVVIEIDPDGRLDFEVDQLGLSKLQEEAMRELTKQLSGVVIFANPPKQGTTSTMYALLKEHDPYTSSVVSYEDQLPYVVEGVNHNSMAKGASKEQVLEKFGALLRADPNVMLVSPVVSSEMTKTIAQYAEDTRFYIPLPANDTLGALKTWLKAVGDPQLAAQSLSAIVSQRLVRKLCAVCKAQYHPDAKAMKRLNLTEATAGDLYKASGTVVVKDEDVPCPTCHGLGYQGRTAAFEIMILDDQARELIAKGEGERLRSHLRKQKMLYLQEAALAKVSEGICDIKEVTRVMSEGKKG